MTNIAASILNWIAKAVPEPTQHNKSVQIGVHLEEVSEMAWALGERSLAFDVNTYAMGYKRDSTYLEVCEINHTELLDSLCDQIVTAIGVAHMFGYDILGALAEVNRSNWSKFVDGKPQFDANGKIIKPAGYSKPVLAPFINQQE